MPEVHGGSSSRTDPDLAEEHVINLFGRRSRVDAEGIGDRGPAHRPLRRDGWQYCAPGECCAVEPGELSVNSSGSRRRRRGCREERQRDRGAACGRKPPHTGCLWSLLQHHMRAEGRGKGEPGHAALPFTLSSIHRAGALVVPPRYVTRSTRTQDNNAPSTQIHTRSRAMHELPDIR